MEYTYVSKTPAASTARRPLPFQLTLFGQLPFEGHGERSKLKAKIQKNIYPETLKNRARKLKNRCLEGVWELSGATSGREMSRRLSWPFWADFGQARDAQNGGKMDELGAKMGPRWRQDEPRWGLSGNLEANWGVILVLGTILAEMAEV